MYSFIDYRVVYPPVERNMLAKIRNGNPKIQGEGETANFLEKFGKMLAFFFGGGKTRGGKNGGIWDAGGYLDAGRRDAMHRVSTDGATPILFILPGIGCPLWPESGT
jgi:hypothetical protein